MENERKGGHAAKIDQATTPVLAADRRIAASVKS